MAGEPLAREGRSWPVRVVTFLAEVKAEMRKVTWPTWPELKKATTVIVIFVFALGLAIGWFDVLLQFVLVKLVARVF